MSDLTACRQPGCAGTIADGYCDVCGMPGEPDQLAAPLRHGIFQERHAEFATDALRALLLIRRLFCA